MGKVTDVVTITELSRLTNKSRPTIYKWLELYEIDAKDELPQTVAELFDLIAERGSKKEIYEFCESKFFSGDDGEELRGIIELLRKNKDKLDLNKLKQFITEESKK